MHATPTAPAGMIAYSVGGVHEDLLPDCTEAIDQIEPELRALDIRVDCLQGAEHECGAGASRGRGA